MALPTKICLATSIPGPRGLLGIAGADGADGISASTTLNMLAGYVMPTQQTSSLATVMDSSVFAMGQIIFMQVAGHMRVDGIPSATGLTLFNLRDDSLGAYPDNATEGVVTIPNGAKLTPAGPQGPVGIISALGAGGDLIGSYPNPLLKLTGTPGAYGDATTVPAFTTDAQGRVVSVTPTPITFPSGAAPTGPASGVDLTGNYPAPTLTTTGVVAGVYGTNVAWPNITVDAKGRITGASTASPASLTRAGLLGSLAINFNTTADQAITMASSRFRITSIIVTDPSGDFSTINPTGGIYTAPGKTGNILVAASQTYTTLVTTVDWKALTLAAYPLVSLVVVPTIYFSLSTSVVPPATANIWIFGEKFD